MFCFCCCSFVSTLEYPFFPRTHEPTNKKFLERSSLLNGGSRKLLIFRYAHRKMQLGEAAERWVPVFELLVYSCEEFWGMSSQLGHTLVYIGFCCSCRKGREGTGAPKMARLAASDENTKGPDESKSKAKVKGSPGKAAPSSKK